MAKDTASQGTFGRITVAADRLFQSMPYDAITMTAIAKEARVSTRTLYSHFARKEELYFWDRRPLAVIVASISESGDDRPAAQRLRDLLARQKTPRQEFLPPDIEIYTAWIWMKFEEDIATELRKVSPPAASDLAIRTEAALLALMVRSSFWPAFHDAKARPGVEDFQEDWLDKFAVLVERAMGTIRSSAL